MLRPRRSGPASFLQIQRFAVPFSRQEGVMKLLLIRHAIAEEREDFARTGKDDRLRPLTDEGRKKMKQGARGLQEIVPEIDLLATSPLTRAAQTGAIVDSVYGGLKEVEIGELSPGSTPTDFLRWLRKQKAGCIAAVGHEPSISLILSWLLTGSERRIFAFRKGGACLLDFPDEVGAGTATLLWALTPAQLRELAD
jgi:phosphohistidine phosphatase